MEAGAIEEVEFAYVYGRATSGGNLASVDVMKTNIDSIRSKYDRGITSCGSFASAESKNVTTESKFSVYPNPASQAITLNYISDLKINEAKIYDVTGRVVKSIENIRMGENSISVAELENGCYFLQVKDESGTPSTKRFIKK
jgi:hypothetical protein